ncbi:DUF2268 domain-containing protein [Heyndrickxia sporothermodurans]
MTDPDHKNIRDFYEYLKFFGMYQPSKMSKNTFKSLKEINGWQKINKIYLKYKKLWDGPDIPIYIFPINFYNRNLIRNTNGKSGVTFKNKMFLFLSFTDDIKEWESLFVHEYNHVVRMNKMEKDVNDYTLLDSLILEGLAEYAVQEFCGEKYVNKWCKTYSEKQLKFYWNNDFKGKLDIKRNHPFHEPLLFGTKFVPVMMGYAIGYRMILEYSKNHDFTTMKGLSMLSEELLENSIFQ